MLNGIQLIRNIGKFDSASTPQQPRFDRLTLIYAENARGKTTLAAVLRSLAENEPVYIEQRRRLGSTHRPHVVLPLAGGSIAQFQNAQWTGAKPDLAVFDDEFVARNVCSGIAIETEHRQNLHELILGAQGVSLNAALQTEVEAIEEHNRQLRMKSEAIPAVERRGLSVDAFCALEAHPDIDAEIGEAERALAAAKSAAEVQRRSPLTPPTLPEMLTEEVADLLSTAVESLSAKVGAQMQAHFASIGPRGEGWVAEGVQRVQARSATDCPFCAQPLNASEIAAHYNAYFSQAYASLKNRVSQQIDIIQRAHGGDVPAAFERSVREYAEGAEFWRRFVRGVPAHEIDTAHVARVWKQARDGLLEALRLKQQTPLEELPLPAAVVDFVALFNDARVTITHGHDAIRRVNDEIARVKERAAAANLPALEADVARLSATRARRLPAVAALCQSYLDEQAAKAATGQRREAARDALDQYRTGVFPSYQNAVNEYLGRLNGGFRLEAVTSVNTRGGSSANYAVLMDQIQVPLNSANPMEPSFRTAMSAGDRNTLALAFFLASLDRDSNLSNKIVVIDDPMTSLDDHRTLATRHEVLRLVDRTAQVIVLSHSKAFLCALWENTQKTTCAPLKIGRAPVGSTFKAWDVRADCITEHDKRHDMVREYIAVAADTNERAVAQALRPMLEAFIRVSYPREFPPGSSLGRQFLSACEQSLTEGVPMLNEPDLEELRRLLDYANRYHHETNPAYQTEAINEQELEDFCIRTIAFTRRQA